MKKCPICGGDMHPNEVMNSLSRVDNKTYICNDCGTKEALEGIDRSLGRLLIKAIEDKDRPAFDAIIERFPRLPVSVMSAVNARFGRKLFEY